MIDSPSAVDATAARGGAAVVLQQIEQMGKVALMFFALLFAAVVVLALFSGFALGTSNENRRTVESALDSQSSRLYVLEYDVKNICAQLMAQDIIEACH